MSDERNKGESIENQEAIWIVSSYGRADRRRDSSRMLADGHEVT